MRLDSLVSFRLLMTTPVSRSSTASACAPREPDTPRKRDIGRKLMPDVESVRLVRLALENDTSPPQSPQVSLARKANLGSTSSEIELCAASADTTRRRWS